ncbi:MAG: hypothetical protein COB15_13670 [Flavobacteriales bacterium]|nr:MAG: hypothetical protein COB15_13670 [Flavobacteriales bacterium]
MRIILFFSLFFLIAFSGPCLGQKYQKELLKKSEYHRVNNNKDSSFYYVNKLIRYELKNGNEIGILDAYRHKINKLLQFNKPAAALSLAIKTYEAYCNKENNCDRCDFIYRSLAEMMSTIKNYRECIKYIDMMSEKNHLRSYNKAEAYRLLGLVDSANITTSAFIEFSKNLENKKILINAYNNQGLIYRNIGNIDSAIIYFLKADKLIDSLKFDRSDYGYVSGNIGNCYFLKGNLNKAYEFISIDSKRSRLNEIDLISYLNAETKLAKIDFKRKEYDKAISRIDNLFKNHETDFGSSKKIILLELYMDIYKEMGNSLKYEYYLQQWISFNKINTSDIIQTNEELIAEYTENSLQQVTLQMKIEKELLKQKLIIKEQEDSKTRLKYWLLTSGLLLLTSTMFFFFWRYRKKSQLKETELKLAKKEKEFIELKMIEESKNVQVLSHELLVKQDFSATLIKQLAKLDNVSKPQIKNIELFIQNELDVKATRAKIQSKMGELSGSFHSNLKIKHPELSKSDVVFASLIAMNMTNKEIATSKSMSSDTVKTTKNRLKKKLNLAKNDNLIDYLNKLL